MVFWRGEVLRHLREYVDAEDIDNVAKLQKGNSAAEVYCCRVKLHGVDKSVRYVAKVSPITDIRTKDEYQRGIMLYNSAQEFCVHLVRPICAFDIGDKSFQFIEYAFGGHEDARTLMSVCELRQCDIVANISKEILLDLNQDSHIEYVLAYPRICIGMILDRSTSKAKRFEQRVRKLIDDPCNPEIRYRGKVYPNPSYYIMKDCKWMDKYSSNLILGRIHGDLHAGNILCNRSSKEEYVLIDYAYSQQSTYLLFDNAYLELSLYCNYFKKTEYQDIEGVFDQILCTKLETSIHQYGIHDLLFHYRNAICTGIKFWMVARKGSIMTHEIEVQFAVARTAAGIHFFSQKHRNEEKELRFIWMYLSFCLKHLFDIIKSSDAVEKISL